MTMMAAEMMKNAAKTQRDVPVPATENRGIITDIKAADLPDESLIEFSNAPFEFENTAALLWQDTQTVYVHACTANRFSENYLTFCGMLEKNIKQLGSMCLTKAVLEQNGMSFPNLSEMSIKELVCMVSFHLRKAHAALEGIYQDNHILGMTYLNWEFRWVGLGNRLKATEVKIQNIREGKVNTEPMLKQAETFKGEPRTNTEAAAAGIAKSLRANPSALPINGSMARLMLNKEKEAEKQAEAVRKERERKIREAERLERQVERLLGARPFEPAKPYEPTKEMKAMLKQLEAEKLRKQIHEEAEALPEPERKESERKESEMPKVEPAAPEPGYITEAQARKELMDDAMRRKDQEAIMAIPLEDQYELHERWEKYLARIEREAKLARNGPSPDVRKALREKRKKRK